MSSGLWLPDGTRVALLMRGGNCCIHNASSGELIHELHEEVAYDFERGADWAVFSHDGAWFICSSSNRNNASVFDVVSGKLLHKLGDHSKGLKMVDCSRDCS